MRIQDLVAQGRLKDAIKLLEDDRNNSKILLLARINTIEREVRRGLLTPDTERVARARIASAILSFAKEQGLLLSSDSSSSFTKTPSMGLGEFLDSLDKR